MFALTINHPHVTSTTTHPSREVAVGQLDQFLDATDHRPRVITATWTHASYEILGHGDHVVGHAAIEEICACTHPERDHDETGCTAASFVTGRYTECGCTDHRPLPGDPALFDLDVPT